MTAVSLGTWEHRNPHTCSLSEGSGAILPCLSCHWVGLWPGWGAAPGLGGWALASGDHHLALAGCWPLPQTLSSWQMA